MVAPKLLVMDRPAGKWLELFGIVTALGLL